MLSLLPQYWIYQVLFIIFNAIYSRTNFIKGQRSTANIFRDHLFCYGKMSSGEEESSNHHEVRIQTLFWYEKTVTKIQNYKKIAPIDFKTKCWAFIIPIVNGYFVIQFLLSDTIFYFLKKLSGKKSYLIILLRWSCFDGDFFPHIIFLKNGGYIKSNFEIKETFSSAILLERSRNSFITKEPKDLLFNISVARIVWYSIYILRQEK